MRRALVYALLKPVDRVLKLLVPTRRARVAYQSFPDYGDNAYYVYIHALQTRNDLEHVWLLKDMTLSARIQRDFETCVRTAKTRGNRVRCVRRQSLAGYFLYLTSHCVFHTHGVYEFSGWMHRRTIVSLWHGMPIKAVGRLNTVAPNPYPTFGKLHFATSHLFRYVVASAFAVEPGAVTICGAPRCDALLEDNPLKVHRAQIRALLNIPPANKLVLWMPTYRVERGPGSEAGNARSFLDDLPPWVIDALGRAAAATRCTVVVKLHGWDCLNDLARPFEHENVVLLKAPDWLRHGVQTYDLIAASDALMSDVSSVLIDYLVTPRPIGLIGFDEASYTRNIVLPPKLLEQSRRFTRLKDEAAVRGFFHAVARGDPALAERNDLSKLLYEDFELPGSESVLRAAGL